MFRDKAIPLYYQISSILRGRILSGELPPGAPLAGEEALGREYGVSRITVRRALSILESEGLIDRQRGRGTFVSDAVRRVEPTRFSGSMEDMIALGIQTSTRVLDQQYIEPPDHVAERLNLDDGARVLKLDKLRLIEGQPFSIVINYLPESIGRRLSVDDLSDKPLLVVLEEKLNIKADEAVQSVEATAADADAASLLDVAIGDPLLRVERTVYDLRQNPVEYVSIRYRADKYYFTVRLKRNRGRENAGWVPQDLVDQNPAEPH
jgi:GntR family transcriptional regulator